MNTAPRQIRVVGWLLLGMMAYAPWTSAHESVSVEGPPATGVPVVLALDVGRHRSDRAEPDVRVLARTQLAVRVMAKPQTQVLWQFAHDEVVLKEGVVSIGADGFGRVNVFVPEVRSRIVCQLVLSADGGTASRRVIVFPSSMLTSSAQRLAEHQLGVIDPTGRVQRALEAEQVAFENLKTDIERDFFSGTMVIMAGHGAPEALQRACRLFGARLKKGMDMLILDPPAGWEGWGITRVEREEPLAAPAVLAQDVGQVLEAADLGDGPWVSFLEAEADSRPLVWFEADAGGDASISGSRAAQALVIARPIGLGWCVAAALPQLKEPETDAVGRVVLDELILWITKKGYAEGQIGEKP